MNSLALRLTGPMQSWGTQSRFEVRDTGQEPSKSGVLGILGAALGFPRTRDEHRAAKRVIQFRELVALAMSVRVDRPGIVARDYQTAGGGSFPGRTRYGVAKADGNGGRTVTSRRYYLADADFRVVLEAEDLSLLETLTAALRHPVWPLYLGRKAFVPGAPILRHLWPGESAMEVLTRREPVYRRGRELKQPASPLRLRFVRQTDQPEPSGEVRCDVPLSFATRDFMLRHVRSELIDIDPSLIQEDPLCISHD